MKKLQINSLITILSVIIGFITVSFFNACKKDVKTDPNEVYVTLTEAQSMMTQLVSKEENLLALPYSQLPKDSKLRILSRMGKLSKSAKWSQSKSFFRDGLSYIIVPINDQTNPLPISSRESLRYLLFSKRNGEKVEMKIIEMYSNLGETLGNDPSKNLIVAIENVLYQEKKSFEEISASVLIYDQFYYNEQSYYVNKGTWQKANIITINKQQSDQISNTRLNKKSSTATEKKSNSTDGQCQSWGMYRITYDQWGNVESEELMYVWNECVDTNDAEAGGGGGSSSGTNGDNKTLVNNVENPCINSVFNTHSSRISHFIVFAMSNENMYQPMNFLFTGSESLPSGTSGQLTSMYINGSGVLTFDILINRPMLSEASQEKILQTYLHEALHGVLLAKGIQFSNIIQHDAMANYYRDMIQSELKLAFPSLSNSEAYALSWSGLQTTKAYSNLSETKRREIEGILGDHVFSTTRGGGTSC